MDAADLLKFGEEEGVMRLEKALGSRLPFNAVFLCTYDSKQFQGKAGLRESLIRCHLLLILPEGYALPWAGRELQLSVSSAGGLLHGWMKLQRFIRLGSFAS